MTQLLISVKNVEESLIARYAGVDVIDLKDPSVGALGALDADVVSQVVAKVSGGALISATVGEGHRTVDALIQDINSRADLGVDVVKIAFSELFSEKNFFTEMLKLTTQGIKLVAVCFADKELDLSLIPNMQKSGFYGAMLDTQVKHASLLDVQSTEYLNKFVSMCDKHQLISGLAGSVNKHHMNALLDLKPTFIGFRGGVCYRQNRAAELSYSKVVEIKRLLLNYNNSQTDRMEIKGICLHI